MSHIAAHASPFARGESTTRRGWVTVALFVATTAGLFGDSLLAGRFLGFRDSLHCFPPLYRMVCNEWAAGRVPLWNHLLNDGQPLAAAGVAGAFYPPQVLVTAIFPEGFAGDVLAVVHLAMCFTAAACIARDAGVSVAAALVAGLSYAFCGSIVFQTYNPIMLAGAAWLAWAVRAGSRLLARPTVGQFIVLAGALAMSVLAGDPQSVFHAGIAIGILLLARIRAAAGETRQLTPLAAASRMAVITGAALLGFLLSLVQLALTREFMLTTTRSADVAPVSIWDVPAFLGRSPPESRGDWNAVLIGRPPPDAGFYREIYRYSVAPWWLAECLSPTLCGRFLSRWPHDLGWEAEAWVATLYTGVVPLAGVLIAIANASLRRRSPGWATLLVFSYLAAIGGFGVVGMVRHVLARAAGNVEVPFYRPGDEVGGLYWMLVSVVPGYSGFRYPAKWLSIFALACSQLAAIGFESTTRDDGPRRFGRLFAWLGALALVTTAGAVVHAGPASRLVVAGGLLSAIVAAAAWLIMSLVHRGVVTPARGGLLLLGLVAVDLVAAGRCYLFTSPFHALLEGGAALETLRERRLPAVAAASKTPRIAAIDDAIYLPRSDDPEQRALFTGMAMRCNTPLLHGWGKVGDPGTAMDADIELFFHASREWKDAEVFARRMFDAAAVEFFVIPRHPRPRMPLAEFEFDWSDAQKKGAFEGLAPNGGRMPGMLAQRPGMTSDDVFVKYVRNESAQPRARIAGRVVRIDPVTAPIGREREQRLTDVAFPNPRIPFLGSTVIVESAAAVDLPDRTGSDAPDEAESCRIVVDEPRRVVVEAVLSAPGLVALADTFHPDWSLTVQSDGGQPRDQPILRANRIHRGCVLPAGRHMLEFTHRSRTFDRTWPVTVAAWIATLGAAGFTWLRRAGGDR